MFIVSPLFLYQKQFTIKENCCIIILIRGETMEKLLFWGHTEHGGNVTKACLSNFYPCEFVFDGKGFRFS